MPTPIGVFRDLSVPTFEEGVRAQIEAETRRRGEGDLGRLLHSGDVWTVK
jgi:2-oxoglutarate ferredoxin oxidoreductase subunit beta